MKVFTQVSEGKFQDTQHFAAPMPIQRASRHLTPGLVGHSEIGIVDEEWGFMTLIHDGRSFRNRPLAKR